MVTYGKREVCRNQHKQFLSIAVSQMNNDQIKVMFAEEEHCKYAGQIVDLIYESALQRGTGIARRSPEYIAQKIKGGKAVVALCDDRLIGFSNIESWES